MTEPTRDPSGERFATIGTWIVGGFVLGAIALVLLKILAIFAGWLF